MPFTDEMSRFLVNNPGVPLVEAALTYADTTANLGSSATFTGTTRDSQLFGPIYGRFVAYCTSGTAGTFRIEQSADGTNWFKAAEVALVAGDAKELNVRLTNRYYRVVFVNGATGMTGALFCVTSGFFRM